LIFPILLLPRSFRFIFLVVASIGTCFSNEGDPRVSHPWVYDCAKTGIGDLQLPPSGSAIEMLLSCMIDQALTDRYNESELNFRHEDIDWCLPSSFLDRSCFSSGFDPHYYLIHCLFQNPTLGSFYFEDETGNTEPFVDDKIVIGPALIVSLCDLINGLRSPKGVSCLFELCQTVSEAPSGVPSHTPSLNPTVEPSTAPSDLESESPSATASKLPSFNPTEARSTPFMETPLGDELTLRYPPLVVSIEILLEFVLLGVAKDLSSPPPKVFLDVLTIGVNNILVANVKGHVLTDILRVNAIKGSDNLSVLLRAAATRECMDCSAPALSDEIVTQYILVLKSASDSGSLADQIEFHGFVLDLPPLTNISIEASSVESVAITNQNKNFQTNNSVSGKTHASLSYLIFWTLVAMTVAFIT
jgi:hypothetical protein